MNLRTIAEMAGVSPATVSNVINGKNGKVSEKTRLRIEEIIRETDYTPARSAGSRHKIRTVGMVLPFVSHEAGYMVSHYAAYCLAQLELRAAENGFRVMLFTGISLQDAEEKMQDGALDGVIVVGAFEKEAMAFQEAVRIPVVFVDTCTESPDLVTVGIDDYRGGFLMARYLIARGHRKFALATPDYREGVIRERIRGFRDACSESGIGFTQSDIYQTDTLFHNGINVGQDIALSGKGYTAIAALSDDMALWIIVGMRQCGILVPENCSVIGFDGLREGDGYAPRLTSVEQNITLKIDVAVGYLMRMMDGEKPEVHDSLPVQIREGESVASLQ